MGILRALVERFGKRGAAEIVEQAERIRPPVREIGAGGMPIAQAQPTRNSFRGGSSDLREAAGMQAAPEAPPQVFEAFHNSPRGGIRRLRGNRSGPDHFHGRGVYLSTDQPNADWGPNTYRVQVRGALSDFPHAGASLSEGDLLSRFQQAAQGRVDLLPQLSVGDAYGRLAEVMPGWTTKGRELAASRALARAGVPGIAAEFAHPQIVVFDDAAMQIVERTKTPRPRTPPPTTPTGTAPFGDPRAFPNSAWEEFGSLQGGTPEARLRAQEQGFDTGRVLYHGTRNPFDAFDPSRTGEIGIRYGDEDAIYLTSSPDVANTYALNNYVTPDAVSRVADNWRGMSERAGQVAGETARQSVLSEGAKIARQTANEVRRSRNSAPNVMPTYARMENPLVVDAEGGYHYNHLGDAVRRARAEGRDGVIARNIRDNGGGWFGRSDPPGPADTYVVFDPRNIRSIFAAFDPAKRDSSDLLAGLALGAPLGGGLLTHAQRRRERARA